MRFVGGIARAFLGLACVAAGTAVARAQSAPEPPLSTGDKWEFGTAETFAPLTILALGVASAARQDEDDFPTFGQGLRGYTKRYGVAFANHAGSDYLTGSVFPILLHEDPRYFRSGRGGFFRRFFYAASRIPVTRTDRGTNRFNFSEFVGNAAAATLSNVYIPRADRTTSYSAETFGLFLASDALTNVLKEFWPNVRHKLFHGPPAGGSAPSPQGLH
jgi:hypothetical protein